MNSTPWSDVTASLSRFGFRIYSTLFTPVPWAGSAPSRLINHLRRFRRHPPTRLRSKPSTPKAIHWRLFPDADLNGGHFIAMQVMASASCWYGHGMAIRPPGYHIWSARSYNLISSGPARTFHNTGLPGPVSLISARRSNHLRRLPIWIITVTLFLLYIYIYQEVRQVSQYGHERFRRRFQAGVFRESRIWNTSDTGRYPYRSSSLFIPLLHILACSASP